jgi:hypothetical protein
MFNDEHSNPIDDVIRSIKSQLMYNFANKWAQHVHSLTQIINISPISTVFFGGGGGIIKINIVCVIRPISTVLGGGV